MVKRFILLLVSIVIVGTTGARGAQKEHDSMFVLDAGAFKHHVDFFNTMVVDPLISANAWDWFCLDNVPYHGRSLTILWDRDGEKYGKGKGFHVFAEGKEVARSDELTGIIGELP